MTMPTQKRVTVLATDVPFPPNRGGRADIWRRVCALKILGHKVQLVFFYDATEQGRPSSETLAVLNENCDEVIGYPIEKVASATLKRLALTGRRPWQVSCRTLSKYSQRKLQDRVRLFGSDIIWCEGPWCGEIAKSIRRDLQLPLAYRSHNIEYQYMPQQAAAARRPRDRLAWTVACIGLRRYEQAMLRQSDWVFDISQDDMAFWRTQGIERISWLPPLAESALRPPPPVRTDPTHDVLFLGNLTTPNNIRAVEWLINEIRPLVQAQRPATRIVVAGSNPGEHVRSLCQASGVTLMANVLDAPALYADARVLVNPVRTGSGTHVKMIEMLMMPAQIVTARQGTKGLPSAVVDLVQVADTAQDFAAAILRALAGQGPPLDGREQVRQMFGIPAVAAALERLSHLAG